MTESPPENLEYRRKRLLYRARYTGMKETDLILGRFAERNLATFSDRELDLFEHLLEAGDPLIFAWVSGREPPPAAHDTEMLKRIRRFHLDSAVP